MQEDLFNTMLKQMSEVCAARECPFVSLCSQEHELEGCHGEIQIQLLPASLYSLNQFPFALIVAKCKLGKMWHIM